MWRLARSAGALVLVLGMLAGCGDATPAAPTSSTSTSAGVPYTLLTHCGIDEIMHDGRWYERVGGPLDDGSGNPLVCPSHYHAAARRNAETEPDPNRDAYTRRPVLARCRLRSVRPPR